MHPSALQLGALAAAWFVYGALHSLLATNRCKHIIATRWPRIAQRYRLVYNTVAVVTLIPPLAMMHALGGTMLWQWSGYGSWIADTLALLSIAAFWWTTRYYDMAVFLGTRRDDSGALADGEQKFVLSPLHRIVRHPWYFLALVVLWTRDMDTARLLSTGVITVYFAAGSYWEEQKLLRLHGERYREYRRHVPGLIPLPWKFLRADDAARIDRG